MYYTIRKTGITCALNMYTKLSLTLMYKIAGCYLFFTYEQIGDLYKYLPTEACKSALQNCFVLTKAEPISLYSLYT